MLSLTKRNGGTGHKTISKVFLFCRIEPNIKLPNQFLLTPQTFLENQLKLSWSFKSLQNTCQLGLTITITNYSNPYLSALDFCNSSVSNIQFDELDFFPSLNWIFLPAVACKIQVWNRLKIQFIKLDISNWRIAKIKCR